MNECSKRVAAHKISKRDNSDECAGQEETESDLKFIQKLSWTIRALRSKEVYFYFKELRGKRYKMEFDSATVFMQCWWWDFPKIYAIPHFRSYKKKYIKSVIVNGWLSCHHFVRITCLLSLFNHIQFILQTKNFHIR